MIRPAKPASTVCLLRDGAAGLEVLMVQRGHTARFMGGAWVFPGGIVDDLDASDAASSVIAGGPRTDDMRWIAAGLRELVEEVRIWISNGPVAPVPAGWLRDGEVYEAARAAGVQLDADRVAYFANWITPTMIPVRFDTRFFAAIADPETVAEPDPRELAAAEWLAPARAMALAEDSDRIIPFPTLKTLEHLGGFASANEFMEHARSLDDVPAVLPRGRVEADGSVVVVLPGEPGYEALGDTEPDGANLSKASRAAAARGHLAELVDNES